MHRCPLFFRAVSPRLRISAGTGALLGRVFFFCFPLFYFLPLTLVLCLGLQGGDLEQAARCVEFSWLTNRFAAPALSYTVWTLENKACVVCLGAGVLCNTTSDEDVETATTAFYQNQQHYWRGGTSSRGHAFPCPARLGPSRQPCRIWILGRAAFRLRRRPDPDSGGEEAQDDGRDAGCGRHDAGSASEEEGER